MISVVIPTYNGRHLLEKHLPVIAAVIDADDEIVVVDDASNDETIEWFKKEYTEKSSAILNNGTIKIFEGNFGGKKISIVLLVQNENKRFAVSVNNGVALAKGEYVLILNNDVEPFKGIKQSLLRVFADSQVFAVGCLEYQQKIGDLSSGKNLLWFSRGIFQHSRAADFSSGPTAWVSGGSGMFDRKKWLELGGFDKRFYPAYWEDIDLSFRAREKGWKILFESSAVVLHQHETTNSHVFGSNTVAAMSWKNALQFTRLHARGMQKAFYYLWQPYWLWQRSKLQ